MNCSKKSASTLLILGNRMKKYLISLDKDSHRRELFFTQPNTADFQVFSAFNTMNETEESLNKRFNLADFLQKYGRNVTKGEVGCTLSHLGVYQLIADDTAISESDYCLICEDDVLFQHGFWTSLENLLASSPKSDIVLVGQSKIADFNHSELEINYPTTFSFLLDKIDDNGMTLSYPYKNYYAGTVAYLIKKSAVRKFLAQLNSDNLPYWLADDFILFGNEFSMDIQIVRPLMAIENPKLNSNLEAVRGSISHSFLQKLLKYPAKKLLAVKRNLAK